MEAHGIPTALVITEPFAPIVAGFAPTVGMEEYTGSIKVPHRVAQMDDDDLRKRHYFLEDHPGHFYAYLKRRKLIVIPKVSMKEDMLCDIAALALDDDSPSESVLISRENYAKQALMMFYPHRTIDDIMLNGRFWSKFVQVGGLTPYKPDNSNSRDRSLRE